MYVVFVYAMFVSLSYSKNRQVSEDDEMEIIRQSPYFDDDKLIKYLQNNHNTLLVLSILPRNCLIFFYCKKLGLAMNGYTLIYQGKRCNSHA